MDVTTQITDMITPSLEALGYRIVEVRLVEKGRSKTLSVMVERLDDVMMSFDDCTEISRTISALMDVEDPIQSAYDLEVMSPGIDRPLTRFEDYERFKDYEIKLECWRPLDGRRRFRGVILGTKDELITLAFDNSEVQIPYSHVKRAKLVMTDALFDAHIKKMEALEKHKDA